jgi:FemAB-related protein (PEP-CTERM system-associated)
MNILAPVTAIKVRPARDMDRGQIDSFLAHQPGAQPCHRLAWSEAVERGCGQRSHYLIAEDEAENLVGVLPLSEIRSRLFGCAMVSAGFGVGGGILAESKAASDALAKAAWSLAGQRGCPTLELRGGEAPPGFTSMSGLYASFVRDLPADDEAILLSIPKRQRREVRRAHSFGLTVAIGGFPEDLDFHYRAYSESVRNLGTPVFPRALFREMLAAFGTNADILTVSERGRPLASVLSFYFKDTVYPFWGGGTWEARARRANDLMYYALLCHAARRGCTRADFGRSKVGSGAYAHKKFWGFEPKPLTYAVRGGSREINPLNPRYQLRIALWKKLPLWAANRLGPPIARGLG